MAGAAGAFAGEDAGDGGLGAAGTPHVSGPSAAQERRDGRQLCPGPPVPLKRRTVSRWPKGRWGQVAGSRGI